MDDRELLKRAAENTGRRVSNYLSGGGLSVCSDTRRSPHNWNPLADDGDALRLAAERGLVVDTSRPSAGEPFKLHHFAQEDFADRAAAIRRAIVRAAAAAAGGQPK